MMPMTTAHNNIGSRQERDCRWIAWLDVSIVLKSRSKSSQRYVGPVVAQCTDGYPRADQPASRTSEAASVRSHEPGALVRSESCRSTVPPGWITRETLWAIDSGVARRDQSRPHDDHSTVCSPARRAAMNPLPVITPYGGRNQLTGTPVMSSMV